jgi:hypothetical protein
MRLVADFLVQAVDYTQMFKPLLEVNPDLKREVDQNIGWAKRFLQKQDHIVWYLRWVRAILASWTVPPEPNDPQYPAYEKLRKGLKNDISMVGNMNVQGVRDLLEHYFSMPIPEIQDRVLKGETPGQLFAQFQRAEDEWKSSRRSLMVPKEQDKIVLQFPDGWAWFELPRAYCSEEAQAMGHCGNEPEKGNPRQHILSLRQPRQVGTKTWWEPHATAILNLNGFIGEFKGKQNNKPVPRLHPYIVELLKLKK